MPHERVADHPQARVIEVLLESDNGGLTLADIASVTGYSRPTVRAAVQQLASAGWVIKEASNEEPAGRGRPPGSIRVDPLNAIGIGVDVRPMFARFAVANIRGDVLDSSEIDHVGETT